MVLTTGHNADTQRLAGVVGGRVHLVAANLRLAFLIGVTHDDGNRALDGGCLFAGSHSTGAASQLTAGELHTSSITGFHQNATGSSVGNLHGVAHHTTSSRHGSHCGHVGNHGGGRSHGLAAGIHVAIHTGVVLTTGDDADAHSLTCIVSRGIHLEAANLGGTFLIGVTHHDGDGAHDGICLLHRGGAAAATIHETTGVNHTGGVLSLHENLTRRAVGNLHRVIHGHTSTRHVGHHGCTGLHPYRSLTGSCRLVNISGLSISSNRNHRRGHSRLCRGIHPRHSIGHCRILYIGISLRLPGVLGYLVIEGGIHIIAPHGHSGLTRKRKILSRLGSLRTRHNAGTVGHNRVVCRTTGCQHQGSTGHKTVFLLHADTETIINDSKNQE